VTVSPFVLPGSPEPFEAGETVLLTDRKKRRYMLPLVAGEQWHSHGGVLEHDAVIGQVEGSVVRTSKAQELLALRPTRDDFVMKMQRGAQVVYSKDQAMILSLADIRPGCTVVEAGAGSGALTLALLDAVGPQGKVISFERRDDHAAIALKNVTRFFGERPPHWTLTVADVSENLREHTPHRVILDMLEPWQVVAAAADALAPGGIILGYTPGVPQVMRFTDALWADGRFAQVATSETLVRGWDVDGLAVRPAHRMVAHTAFLTTARRVLHRDDGGPLRRRRKLDTGGSIDWDAVDVAHSADATASEADPA
jgi:tRNA (adenine57-N1/adenine58-N1)-methyltransferase catalytic subunit